jgi:hypothetical protein
VNPRRLLPRNHSLLALVLVALPFVAGLVVLVLERGTATDFGGDASLIELATMEAASGRRLLGAYSRYGWHHPGPIYFYLLAVPYRLLGPDAGLQAGALLINAVAAIGIVAAVRRIADTRAAWGAAVVVLAVCLGVGPVYLRDPWNPFVVVLPLLLFAVLCTAVAAGRPRALWVAAVVGSFCVQTHVGTAPLVAVLGLMAVVVRRRGGPVQAPAHAPRNLGASRPVRAAVTAVTLAALALVWLPPLVEQARASVGNLASLARFAVGAHAGHPVGEALLGYIVGASAFPLGKPPLELPHVAGVGQVLVVVASLLGALACVVHGRRSADRVVTVLGATSLLAAAVCVVAASRVVGPLLGYLVYWMVAAPALAWLGLGILAARRVGPALRAGMAAGLALAVGLGLATSPASLDVHPPSALVGSLAVAQARSVTADTVSLRIASKAQWPTAAGVSAALERAGVRVRVQGGWISMYSADRRPTGDEDLEIILSDPGAIVPGLASARGFGDRLGTVVHVRRLPAGDAGVTRDAG